MEQFSVKLDGLNSRIDEEESIRKKLANLEADIWSVRSCLSFQVGCQQNINNNLKNLAEAIGTCQSDTSSMKKVLNEVRKEYRNTEKIVSGHRTEDPLTIDEIWDALTTVGAGLAISAINPGLGFAWLVTDILVEHGETETSHGVGEVKYKFKKWDRADNDVFSKNKSKTTKTEYEWQNGKFVQTDKKTTVVDENNPTVKEQKTDEEKRKEKTKDVLDSITIYENKISRSGSVAHAGVSEDNEYSGYSANVDVLKAEASAGFKVTARGVQAEAGVALTALSADAAGRLGSEYNNVHASGEVAVGKVEAKASAGIGITDKGLEFGASASAEAIAAEISGKAGVAIGGTEVNVGGSLNFGVGAHAKVGLQDGKLSFDVGASVGVGASVQFEVDMSKTVDYVVENFDNIKTGVCEAATDVYNVATSVIDSAGDAINDFADGVGDTLSKGWSTVTGLFKW